MKNLLFVCFLIVSCALLSNAQGFIGKTKEQVKKELTKDFSPTRFPDCVGVRNEGEEFTRFWWADPSNKNINFYAYFNKNGICILEQLGLSPYISSDLTEFFINFHKEKSKFYFYTLEKGSEKHEFVPNKIMVEYIVDRSEFGIFRHFWYFNDTYKNDVLKYFQWYYIHN